MNGSTGRPKSHCSLILITLKNYILRHFITSSSPTRGISQGTPDRGCTDIEIADGRISEWKGPFIVLFLLLMSLDCADVGLMTKYVNFIFLTYGKQSQNVSRRRLGHEKPLSEMSNSMALKSFAIFSLLMFVFVWYLVEFISDEVKNSKRELRQRSQDTFSENQFLDAKSNSPHSPAFDFKLFMAEEIKEMEEDERYDRHLVLSPLVVHMSFAGTFCLSEPWILHCDIGFAAYLLITLDHLGICYLLGANPTVTWRKCNAVCSDDQNINSWNWYFQPVNPGIEGKSGKGFCLADTIGPDHLHNLNSITDISHPETIKINDTFLEPRTLLNLSFQPRQAIGFEGFGNIITRGVRQWANFLIKTFVKVNKPIQDLVQKFYDENLAGHTLLAVHIRGTDHADETDSPTLPPLSAWIQTAQQIFNSIPSPKKIFIAGDNTEAIKEFLKHFGKKNVAFIKALRAVKYDGLPVHDTSGYDPYKLGSQVLTDILLMSRCHHFLHAESSVASLVAYFNPELHIHFFSFGNMGQQSHKAVSKNKNMFKPIKHKDHNKSYKEPDNNEEEGMDMFVKCFQNNSPYSTCPDMSKGIFLRVSELRHFTGYRSEFQNT